jgi:hypothetical protein
MGSGRLVSSRSRQNPHLMAVRMGYGVRDGFADRSDPTLWWASCLDLDQSIGLATCRGATIGIA